MLDHANLNAMCHMVIDAFALPTRPQPADPAAVSRQRHCRRHAVTAAGRRPGRRSRAGSTRRLSSNASSRAGATYFSAVPTIYTMLADLPARSHPTPPRCGSRSAARPRPVSSCWTSSNPVTASRSSRDTGLSEGTCASTGNPLNGRASRAQWGCRCPGSRSGSSTPPATPSLTARRRGAHQGSQRHARLSEPAGGDRARPLSTAGCTPATSGRLDEDGYLVLVDRAKDMIIRGGENIYPKEIETVVYQLPQIAEAAVVGRANPVYGEEPVLFVSLNAGAHARHGPHRRTPDAQVTREIQTAR